MSTSPSNADLIRSAYSRWEDSLGQDPEPFFAFIAEDFTLASVLDPPDLHELARDHYGLDRVREYFAALDAEWEMIEFPTKQVVEQGETVIWIGHCTWRNRQTGRLATTPKVDIWTFRSGRAVRMFEMFDTLAFARGAGLLPQLAAATG